MRYEEARGRDGEKRKKDPRIPQQDDDQKPKLKMIKDVDMMTFERINNWEMWVCMHPVEV